MSNNAVPFRQPMTPKTALKRIRKAATSPADNVGYTDHALMDKMGDDILLPQVLTVLREGRLIRGPTWDNTHEDWTCVLAKTVSGKRVHVVASLEDGKPDDVTVVTVY
ncbi:MAG: DUF4258 domain-containing protein [Alphaproteobacteria bacterium]